MKLNIRYRKRAGRSRDAKPPQANARLSSFLSVDRGRPRFGRAFGAADLAEFRLAVAGYPVRAGHRFVVDSAGLVVFRQPLLLSFCFSDGLSKVCESH
jgi:hypothetical protein